MKRTMFRNIILSVFMLAAFAVTAQEQSDLRERIMTMNKEMADLGKAGKFDEMQKYYLVDVISLPNNQPMMRGYKQIQAQHQYMVQTGIKVTEMEFNTTDLMVDGNMIVEIGTYKMSMTMPGLSTPMNDVGKYLTVWKKVPDGSLKIAVETWNTDVNPNAKKEGTSTDPNQQMQQKPGTGTNTSGTESQKSTTEPVKTEPSQPGGVILKSDKQQQGTGQDTKPESTGKEGKK